MRFFVLIVIFIPLSVFAHGGRTNSEGCHNNRKTNNYHCHGNSTKEIKSKARTTVRLSAREYNCNDFNSWQEAQDFFLRAGGPVVDPYDLDRDHDGMSCESLQ